MSTPLTNSINDAVKTDKSDKTDIVTNNTFLQTIFGQDLKEARPIIVTFSGNPNTAGQKEWSGQPWINDFSFAIKKNNYFSLSVFKQNEAGHYRRKKSQFQALHAVMLDDIGTKVRIERLTLTPNWLLETSPANYQAGYILDVPIYDNKVAEQLMNAIIRVGLCDPGANGPTTRLARLPVAINGKHEPRFPCQLEAWLPEKRYSLQELINGLQLELIETKSKQKNSNKHDQYDEESEQIWTPRPEENTVIVALKKRNLYKQPLGESKHDMTCPWVHEHTNCIDNGSAYFEPDDNYPIGAFKCLHGHCRDRRISDLLKYLDVDFKSARMKPIIRVIKGEINRIVDMAECELAAKEQYYQRGGVIVSVYTDPSTNETLIKNITLPALVRTLSGIATWEQYDSRSKKWVRIDPPARHASILFDSNSYRHLSIINGIARQPYLRSDGSLMKEAGYDTDTGMFGVFDSRKFIIPIESSRDEALSALNLLNELLDEFWFNSEVDRAAALAAILTAAIRQSLDHAPMFHVRAHTVGSGKSYLCELITAFATPQRGTPTTFPADDEECRKLLLAELLRSPAVIEFDNLTDDILPHKSLCSTLTSEHISGRILGLSKTVTVSSRTLFVSSGNNVSPIKDMTRRCVIINLNPEVEIPATRVFKQPNLITDVLQYRERYVSAAIIIIRAWFMAGKPITKCKSLAGFGNWSDLCRQPLLWLGCMDPATSIFESIKEDPDRDQLGRLLVAWEAVFGNTPIMIREAIRRSTLTGDENKELKEILHDIADERGNINHHRLGRWIKRHEGQIVNELRFIQCSGNTSAIQWKVELVSSVISVSRREDEKNVNHNN